MKKSDVHFVAIDFETASSERGSACEIGITEVENGSITESYSLLIKPRNNWFHSFNTQLHGIDAEKVKNEPEFNELWEELYPVFQGKNLLAHNAGFDMGVLRSVLEMYQLEFPSFNYSCSVQIARKAWPELGSYKLNRVSEFLNIPLDHHHARDDSEASAKIALAAFEKYNVQRFDQIQQVFSLPLKKFEDRPLSFTNSYRKSRKPSIKDIEFDRDKIDQGHEFYGKCVVFTGKLSKLVRKEAQKIVLEIGGSCSQELDNRVDFLVVGQKAFQDYKNRDSWLSQNYRMSSKLRLASEMQAHEHPIEIVSEEWFLEVVGDRYEDDSERDGLLFS